MYKNLWIIPIMLLIVAVNLVGCINKKEDAANTQTHIISSMKPI